jgi:hypothetical protein
MIEMADFQVMRYERYSTRRPPARRTSQLPTIVNGSLADTRTYSVGADVRQIRGGGEITKYLCRIKIKIYLAFVFTWVTHKTLHWDTLNLVIMLNHNHTHIKSTPTNMAKMRHSEVTSDELNVYWIPVIIRKVLPWNYQRLNNTQGLLNITDQQQTVHTKIALYLELYIFAFQELERIV